jgi:hypothetical protein
MDISAGQPHWQYSALSSFGSKAHKAVGKGCRLKILCKVRSRDAREDGGGWHVLQGVVRIAPIGCLVVGFPQQLYEQDAKRGLGVG